MYEKPEVCAECGGACCKRMSGGTFPEDFGPDVEKNLREAFAAGSWSIDWWDGELNGAVAPLFVRPRHKDAPVVDGSWGGECIFLEEDGCSLSPEDRPTTCRELEPKRNEDCVSHLDIGNAKEASVTAWMPYQDLLRELQKEYR